MPVRFRCKHCNQLLGIARRKIGTEVRCPECHKRVRVPSEDAPGVEEPTRKNDFLFEGDPKDPHLQPSVVERAEEPPRERGAPKISPAVEESFDAELYRLPEPAQAGVILSPLYAVLLTVGAVIILALAFTVGLLVGRYVL